MLLRRATVDDAPTLAALNRWVHEPHVAAEPAVYPPLDPAAAEAWARERLAAADVRALVAEVDGVAVGLVVTQVVRRPATPFTFARAFLLVDQLAVAPAARRRGVGRALMAAVRDLARELGLARIELDVRAWNQGAVAFYRALGWAPAQLRLGLSL